MKNQNLWFNLTLVLLVVLKSVSMEPQWYDTADGQRYLIDTEEKYNWYQAWNECARYDAQLIVIDSEVKNQILKKLLKTLTDKSKYLWIGGTVFYEKITFHWAPNEQEFTFTNWFSDEVNKYTFDKRCVYLMRQRKQLPWNIINCDAKEFGFICEEMRESVESMEKTGDLKVEAHESQGNMYNGSIYGLIG